MEKDNKRLFLLLTGTIDTSVYNNVGNNIKDVNERLHQYVSAITRYLSDSPFTDIVFIENSNYDLNIEKIVQLASKNNKRFEFIHGNVYTKDIIEKGGKSFGDSMLMNEALEQSSLLHECEFFYKITGRLFLKNSYNITKTAYKHRNEFIIHPIYTWCHTNIFKIYKEDYLKYFADVFQDCDEHNNIFIENIFYKRIVDNHLKIYSFNVYPYLEGKIGFTLKNYSGNIFERIFRNILCKLKAFEYNSVFQRIIRYLMKKG